MGPFTCMDGNGFVRSFSRMHNGRPADSHYMTQFFPRGHERNLHSLNSLVHVEGMQMLSMMMKGGKGNGPSKIFLKNGRVFIGEQIEGRMSHGTLIKMQQDNTFNVYDVVYDHVRDGSNNIYADL